MSKEKPLHQKSAQGKITRGQFHSVEHLVGTVTVQSSENSVSVSSSVRQFQSRGHSALGTFLAASSSCPKLHTRAWSLPGVGSTLARPRRRLLRRRDLPWRPTGDGTVAQRRSAPPNAPLLSAWPHACQRTPVAPSPWPGKHGTCSLPPTGRATPVPSSSPIAPNPSPFST